MSAILVIVADKGKPDYAWIAVLPTILFFFLDTYYLSLEIGFRKSYELFVKKLHDGDVQSADLYEVVPGGDMFAHRIKAVTSISVWPFYSALMALVVLAKIVVIGSA